MTKKKTINRALIRLNFLYMLDVSDAHKSSNYTRYKHELREEVSLM